MNETNSEIQRNYGRDPAPPTRKELEAEVERLRAALTRIEELYGAYDKASAEAKAMSDIARQALEGSDG